MADSPSPLCSASQFASGAFSDLAAYYVQNTQQPLEDILVEATRACESECGRRLAPFTGVTESHRGEGMDPDEYTDSANLPMDLQGTLGRSYAYALGASTLVRHCWLNEFAPRYQDLWTYSVSEFTIVRSYGGSENLSSSQYTGPDADSGHLWLNLGIFAPIGSYFYVTYGGGYTVSTPGDLVRACKNMAAWMIVTELNPEDTNHDPDRLHATALMLLQNYDRS
jgi:hypothetical protein